MTRALQWSAAPTYQPCEPTLWPTVEPLEADPRDGVVLYKLGTRGWNRLCQFRDEYTSGWGNGSGRPLSPRALETFYRFMWVARFPKIKKPSIFFTGHGTLELSWEDESGAAIQTEFTSTGIEYYLAS